MTDAEALTLFLSELDAEDIESAAIDDDADDLRMARGIVNGVLLSLPIWGLIIWVFI